MTPITEKITANFTWGEMTRTGQSSLQEINRREAEAVKPAIVATAHMLQAVRERWGPLRVNSAFRGPAVNFAVGGSKSSQHMSGEAVDFTPLQATIEQVFDWIRLESKLPYGQVIDERPSATSRWIHLSLGEPWRKGNNRQALFFDGKSYTPVK
jgi:zinc D-Ala-D-Ala carboxypeptidase